MRRGIQLSRGPVQCSRGGAALRASDAPGPRAGLGEASPRFWGAASNSPGGPSSARALRALRASDAPGPRAGLGEASPRFWGAASNSPGGPSSARALRALRASDAPGPRAGLGEASPRFWGAASNSPGGPSSARALRALRASDAPGPRAGLGEASPRFWGAASNSPGGPSSARALRALRASDAPGPRAGLGEASPRFWGRGFDLSGARAVRARLRRAPRGGTLVDAVAGLGEASEAGADVGGVGGGGGQLEVAAEVGNGGGDAVQPLVEEAARPQVFGGIRDEDEQQVDRGERVWGVVAVEVGAEKVAQHAAQDVGRARRPDGLGRNLTDLPAAVQGAQPVDELVMADRAAAEEGVEEYRPAASRNAHQKMSGKAHPLDRQPEAAGHLDEDHRKGDRDAGAAVQDVVQEAVARVVIVLGVAAEPARAEEMIADGQRDVLGRHPGADAGAGGVGERLEPGEVTLGLEVGVREARDLER